MTAQKRLWEIAMDQHGYVTTGDARDAGVTPHALKLLAHRDVVRREGYGVYRFNRFPASAADDYQQAVLWTGEPGAVLSHETALDVLDLCDVNPTRVHVTVPRTTRIRRQGGEQVSLHREDLGADSVGWWEGIRCVTESTAIAEVITARSTPVHLIRQAIDTARSRGRISPAEAGAFLERLERDVGT
jgi:predicted transcriptional regulator of viral defense system